MRLKEEAADDSGGLSTVQSDLVALEVREKEVRGKIRKTLPQGALYNRVFGFVRQAEAAAKAAEEKKERLKKQLKMLEEEVAAIEARIEESRKRKSKAEGRSKALTVSGLLRHSTDKAWFTTRRFGFIHQTLQGSTMLRLKKAEEEISSALEKIDKNTTALEESQTTLRALKEEVTVSGRRWVALCAPSLKPWMPGTGSGAAR